MGLQTNILVKYSVPSYRYFCKDRYVFQWKKYIFKYFLIASPVVLSYAANLSLCPFPSAAAHVDS